MSVYDNNRKTLKTEETLINAMNSLLKKSHIEDITVEAFCEEAKVDRAVFYAYFSDKDDLINHYKGLLSR